MYLVIVFFNDPATTEIYTYGHTLSLHDALPICSIRKNAVDCLSGFRRLGPTSLLTISRSSPVQRRASDCRAKPTPRSSAASMMAKRSEEHTSELQSLMRISYAVLCLKKKKKNNLTKQ